MFFGLGGSYIEFKGYENTTSSGLYSFKMMFVVYGKSKVVTFREQRPSKR